MTAAALGAPAPDPGAGQVVQTAHSGDFLRLTRLWQHRTHFSLLFAFQICDILLLLVGEVWDVIKTCHPGAHSSSGLTHHSTLTKTLLPVPHSGGRYKIIVHPSHSATHLHSRHLHPAFKS